MIPTYVKSAKRRWKTLKSMLEHFHAETGRDMTFEELQKALRYQAVVSKVETKLGKEHFYASGTDTD